MAFGEDAFLEDALVGEHHQNDAAEDEGDAEPLAHVEGHAFLKIDLFLFDELDEEAHAEEGNEPPTEEAAVVELAVLLAIDDVADHLLL